MMNLGWTLACLAESVGLLLIPGLGVLALA